MGRLFRSKQTSNDKRELIILVTPKVLDDRSTEIENYNLKFSDQNSKNLLEEIK